MEEHDNVIFKFLYSLIIQGSKEDILMSLGTVFSSNELVKYMLSFSSLFWVAFLDFPLCENVKKVQK
jgi:hypothetical protein